ACARRRGKPALLWSDSAEIAKEINEKHTNERHLPGVALAPPVRATADLGEVAAGAQLLLLAVRSPRVEATVRALGDVVSGRHVVVHAIGSQTHAGRVSELVRRETPVKRVGVVAGPALAKDLRAGRPRAIVAASPFEGVTALGRQGVGGAPAPAVGSGGGPTPGAGASAASRGPTDGVRRPPGPTRSRSGSPTGSGWGRGRARCSCVAPSPRRRASASRRGDASGRSPGSRASGTSSCARRARTATITSSDSSSARARRR